MKRIFVLILAFALLLPGLALAEGETPPASPAAETTPDAEPTASPAPTPVPTPTPTPIVDQLIIDSRNLYNGMDKTYGDGYVPRVVNGRVYIILPLLGETYDGKVTVTADLGTTVDSPFVFGNYSQTVGAGWSSYVFVFEIPLVKGRINGSYPVTFRADYLDVLGQQKQQGFTVYVTITDGKNPPDPNDVPKQEVEKPELFISACTVSPDVIGGEEEFAVTVTIDNIGAIRARSVRLSYGSEAVGIVPVETNSAMHLPNIASGESETASFRLRTTKDVLAGEQPFYITLDYVDLYGGVYSSTRTFLAHVTQPAEMSYDSVSMPREVTAGETISLPANVFNIGKSTLRNVSVNLTGAGLYPTSSVFLGDIQPGQAGYGEMKVFIGMLSMTEGYTESYGRTTGTYVISYTDDAGEIHTVEQQIFTEIKQPVIAGEKTEAERKAEEEQKRAMSQWWVSALVAFAIIAIVVAFIVVGKFTRMMKMK
ncbi:MAG: COG1361 S-layer family protein [Christensenellales bacterium]